METELKFRIKVIERNDGVKMYHPQVYMPVGVERKKNILGMKKDLELVYGWRGFVYSDMLLTTCDKESDDGCGSSGINDAYEHIEKYKLDLVIRNERRAKAEKELNDKLTKSVTYMDIPPPAEKKNIA